MKQLFYALPVALLLGSCGGAVSDLKNKLDSLSDSTSTASTSDWKKIQLMKMLAGNYGYQLEGTDQLLFGEKEFEDARPFADGFAVVAKGSGDDKKWGFINVSGSMVMDYKLHDLKDFSNGLALAQETKDGLWGFVNTKGEWSIKPKFKNAWSFANGCARIAEGEVMSKYMKAYEDCKYGFISTKGDTVIPIVFTDASDFGEGLAAVCKNGKYGFIDSTGKEIIAFKYDQADKFVHGMAPVFKGSKCGFMDKSEKVIIPIAYSSYKYVYHYIGWNIFDEDDIEYDIEGKYVIVSKGEKWGMVDLSGNTVIDFQYSELDLPEDGYIGCKKGEACGLLDISGKELIPCEYDELGKLKEGLISAKKGEKWGFLDATGKVVIDFKYDRAYDFGNGEATVYDGDVYVTVDKTGKEKYRADAKK
jgi:hypothetical protein